MMNELILILQNKATLKPTKWTLDAILNEINKSSPNELSKKDPLEKIVDHIDLYTNYLLGEVVLNPMLRPHKNVDWHHKSTPQHA